MDQQRSCIGTDNSGSASMVNPQLAAIPFRPAVLAADKPDLTLLVRPFL